MKTFSRYLKNSTIISNNIFTSFPPKIEEPETIIVVENGVTPFIRIVNHKVPELSNAAFKELESQQPEFVTRHFKKEYLNSYIGGYYRFGTLVEYRGKYDHPAGRLNDIQESRQHETLNSKTGIAKYVELKGSLIQNIKVEGTEDIATIELVVNDYCSCLSKGKFCIDRANKIRDAEEDEDKKPDAYITYRLSSLKYAILKHLRRKKKIDNLNFVGRCVDYNERDLVREISDVYFDKNDKNALSIWMNIAFTKSPRYSHEEEFRLLLVDQKKLGSLDHDAEQLVISYDEEIAAARVDEGVFWDCSSVNLPPCPTTPS